MPSFRSSVALSEISDFSLTMPVVYNYTNRNKTKNPRLKKSEVLIGIVGMAGFEPAASTSQMWRDTGLRYIPKGNAKVSFIVIDANIF